jgi:hypothetical protein
VGLPRGAQETALEEEKKAEERAKDGVWKKNGF